MTTEDSLHVVHPRAAGLDVHKMAITATVRLARLRETATTETREFTALPSGTAAMVGWLASEGVEAALMEGTGIDWEAPFDALAEASVSARKWGFLPWRLECAPSVGQFSLHILARRGR